MESTKHRGKKGYGKYTHSRKIPLNCVHETSKVIKLWGRHTYKYTSLEYPMYSP